MVGHDAKAEFGGAAGGVVNLVSKSGGNSFHGSAFEYVRNDAFDARNSLDVCTTARCKPLGFNANGTPIFGVPEKPLPFRQNQFGADPDWANIQEPRLSFPVVMTAGVTARPARIWLMSRRPPRLQATSRTRRSAGTFTILTRRGSFPALLPGIDFVVMLPAIRCRWMPRTGRTNRLELHASRSRRR